MKQIICYSCGTSLNIYNEDCPEKEKHKHKISKKWRTYQKFNTYVQNRVKPDAWDKKMAKLEMTSPKGSISTRKKGISRNKGRKWTKEHKQKLIDNSRINKEDILSKKIKEI